MLGLERHGNVVIVHQRSGENRFNGESISDWHAVLDELESVEGPLALVTTGEGKFYSNGLDLDWLAANPDAGPTMMPEVYRLFGRILAFPGITVSAVNGHAFGGGAILSSLHDYSIMREDRGYWCMPEVDLGLPLTTELHAACTARIPAASAHEALMTGRRYGGREAFGAGIVHGVAPEELVLPQAIEIATLYSTKSRPVIGEHKRLAYGETIELLGATAHPFGELTNPNA